MLEHLGVAGRRSFAGYHSLADAGHGTFIYAIMIDTLIEQPPIAGADPEGNPEAESVIDTSAHETVEAITNPEGTGGWTRTGSRSPTSARPGRRHGEPLGYAPDGSPYNQLINGHEYDIQEMWSNAAKGCEQSARRPPRRPAAPGRLHAPVLALVSGSIGERQGRDVRSASLLIRAGAFVAEAAAVTRAGASRADAARPARRRARRSATTATSWSSNYGNGGPAPDLIATGGGGNPFTEAGYTDWFDLDTGFALGPARSRWPPAARSAC